MSSIEEDEVKQEEELGVSRSKNKPDAEMLRVVNCEQCGLPDYYGMLHWKSGKQLCRHCIYKVWTNDNWKPGKTDYTFPLYKDGINHRELKED